MCQIILRLPWVRRGLGDVDLIFEEFQPESVSISVMNRFCLDSEKFGQKELFYVCPTVLIIKFLNSH